MKDGFVLDASVAVSWALEDEDCSYSDRVLDMLLHTKAFVPPVWPLEVANALLMAERRGRLGSTDVEEFLSLIMRLPIEVEAHSVVEVWGEVLHLAREKGLSVYDATYLNLALRLGVPLATLDVALKRAAEDYGVRIL